MRDLVSHYLAYRPQVPDLLAVLAHQLDHGSRRLLDDLALGPEFIRWSGNLGGNQAIGNRLAHLAHLRPADAKGGGRRRYVRVEGTPAATNDPHVPRDTRVSATRRLNSYQQQAPRSGAPAYLPRRAADHSIRSL